MVAPERDDPTTLTDNTGIVNEVGVRIHAAGTKINDPTIS
jgi:hypothetical protein